jgi:hypothetical protein
MLVATCVKLMIHSFVFSASLPVNLLVAAILRTSCQLTSNKIIGEK